MPDNPANQIRDEVTTDLKHVREKLDLVNAVHRARIWLGQERAGHTGDWERFRRDQQVAAAREWLRMNAKEIRDAILGDTTPPLSTEDREYLIYDLIGVNHA